MKPATPPPPAPKPKAQPRPTAVSKPFWEGANNAQLLLQISSLDGRAQFFPRPFGIAACEPVTWQAASGRGTLRAFTLCRVPAPGFEAEAPYVMGIVQLEEGPRVLSRIVNVAPAQIKVGMPVQLAWDTSRADQHMYVFEGVTP